MTGLDALTAGVGQTDQRDTRHAIGGLLAVQGPTVLDIRTGVLAGPGTTALLVGTSDTGQMTVAINPHVLVGSRGTANGPYLGPTLDAQAKVNIDPAPGTGSRIDIVYARQRDMTSGVPSPDASAGPEYGVLKGTSTTGTPVKGDLSTIAGAVELGTVKVSASATSTNGAGVTISQTVRQTVARGGILPIAAEADVTSLAAYAGMAVYCTASQATGIYDGATWHWWDSVTQTYTPTWSSAGGTPTLGNGTLVGRYRRMGTTCWVEILLDLGSTSNGSNGGFAFTLPFNASASREQAMTCWAFTAGGSFTGVGLTFGGSTIQPWLPISPTNTGSARAATSSNGSVGTGTPAIAAQYTFGSGHNLRIEGTYEMAAG